MNEKIFIKIVLDGKPLCSKPLLIYDNLTSIREKLKERTKAKYIFLDKDKNDIDIQDENDCIIEDIVNNNIINIKSISVNVNVFSKCENKNICSINCSKKCILNEVRNLIKNEIQFNFFFLDSDENFVEINDEKDINLESIMKNDSVKIQNINSSCDSPPALLSLDTLNESNKQKFKSNIIKNKEVDFSKYEIQEKRHGGTLTIFKYPYNKVNIKGKSIYEYYYNNDLFDNDDYENAYVLLFCGKTGDGKTTAINAFFNIIKGIKLKDNYRFILINEPNKLKGQAESQTEGIHLYYLKDINNNPIIIIDSQGFGDTGGKSKDDMIKDAFKNVFSNLISHINIVCFIVKSTDIRIDINIKYIFSSVTSLFSKEITENFFFLSTFANRDTLYEGPGFINSIKTDEELKKLLNRMDKKWWYAFDSKCILDNDSDELTKYSFSQLTELYEVKIKKSKPKIVKDCVKVLENRYELKTQIEILKNNYEKLILQEKNLKIKENEINETCNTINELENKIYKFEKELKDDLNIKEMDKKLKELNQELYERINELDNCFEDQIQIVLDDDDQYNTICTFCKKNCHEPCDCLFNKSFERCKCFNWATSNKKRCNKCGCLKKNVHQNTKKNMLKRLLE